MATRGDDKATLADGLVRASSRTGLVPGRPPPACGSMTMMVTSGDAGPRKIGKGPPPHCVYPWGHQKEVYPVPPSSRTSSSSTCTVVCPLGKIAKARACSRTQPFCEYVVNHCAHSVKFKELVFNNNHLSITKRNDIHAGCPGKHSMLPDGVSFL